MSGCRHNAKNTLVKNYLYLAEQNGATVLPLTTVTRITPRARDEGGYDVRVKFTKAKSRRGQKVLTAEHVVMAAASLGTQKLLHRMKDEGHLPRLSGRLGYLSRTNSESILGAIAPKDDPTDYTYGVAITSCFHPDADTHVEPVRYGKGFNTMAMLQTVLTDGDDRRLEDPDQDLAARRCGCSARTSSTSTTSSTGPSGPSSRWSCRPSTTRSRRMARRARSAPGS